MKGGMDPIVIPIQLKINLESVGNMSATAQIMETQINPKPKVNIPIANINNVIMGERKTPFNTINNTEYELDTEIMKPILDNFDMFIYCQWIL